MTRPTSPQAKRRATGHATSEGPPDAPPVARVLPYEEVEAAYAAAFDESGNGVLCSPAWLGALPSGSVRVAVVEGQRPVMLAFSVGRRKGIPLVSNPALSPWAELIGIAPGQKPSAQIGDANDASAAIALALRKLGVVRLRLQRTTPSWLGFHWAGYFANARISYVLEGKADEAWSAMKTERRTAIRAAAKAGVEVRALLPAEVPDAIRLFDSHAAERGFAHGLAAPAMAEFMRSTSASGAASLRGAFDREGRLCAVGFFADDARTRTYLMGAQDGDGPSARAVPGLMWAAIEEALAGGRAFDFEGSMLRGVEQFVRGFGAQQRLDATMVWVPRPQRAFTAMRRRLAG